MTRRVTRCNVPPMQVKSDSPRRLAKATADVAVVGSVAIDSLETPFGNAEDILGGSAVYFSLAASLFASVRLVGVVGSDFPEGYRSLLADRGVDIDGLETSATLPTFRWRGRYHQDPNQRDTLELSLGAFDGWTPQVPERARCAPFVFCANIHPAVQRQVLSAMRAPRFTLLDTIDHWIDSSRDELVAAMAEVDAVVLNDDEARRLAGDTNLLRAARAVRDLGPRTVVVKKGEHGLVMLRSSDADIEGTTSALPAYPVANVVDPTGAGDTFAGGMLGSLAESCGTDRSPEAEDLLRAVAYGTVLASFSVESFGTDRVAQLTREEVDERYRKFAEVVRVP